MIYTQRIKNIREDRDLLQKDVAKVLGLDRSYYGKYERGLIPMPINHLMKLCEFYDVSPEYFLGYTDEVKPLPKK